MTNEYFYKENISCETPIRHSSFDIRHYNTLFTFPPGKAKMRIVMQCLPVL